MADVGRLTEEEKIKEARDWERVALSTLSSGYFNVGDSKDSSDRRAARLLAAFYRIHGKPFSLLDTPEYANVNFYSLA